jgi:hypothetical protein
MTDSSGPCKTQQTKNERRPHHVISCFFEGLPAVPVLLLQFQSSSPASALACWLLAAVRCCASVLVLVLGAPTTHRGFAARLGMLRRSTSAARCTGAHLHAANPTAPLFHWRVVRGTVATAGPGAGPGAGADHHHHHHHHHQQQQQQQQQWRHPAKAGSSTSSCWRWRRHLPRGGGAASLGRLGGGGGGAAGGRRHFSSKTQLIHPVTGSPIGAEGSAGAKDPWASAGDSDPWAGLPDFVGASPWVALCLAAVYSCLLLPRKAPATCASADGGFHGLAACQAPVRVAQQQWWTPRYVLA